MGVEIKYTLNGRTVSQLEFFGGIEGEVRKVAVDGLTRQLESDPCPKHGKTATVTEVKETSEGFNFALSGCCNEGVQHAFKSVSD